MGEDYLVDQSVSDGLKPTTSWEWHVLFFVCGQRSTKLSDLYHVSIERPNIPDGLGYGDEIHPVP